MSDEENKKLDKSGFCVRIVVLLCGSARWHNACSDYLMPERGGHLYRTMRGKIKNPCGCNKPPLCPEGGVDVGSNS